jgi:signal transduction histidine kinase
VLLLVAVMFYRNSINQKKSRILLQQQKNELEQSLRQLKTTQTQLVQAEKMASLGELTAGIAHEIQNPLNFVNNFAELNAELIDELATEANKGNLEEVKLLAKDIKENETKINHHGKRADAIVKNMLQHSRKTSGQKEFTDINALCDEYLRLAYHGLRAKEKSFNAQFETDFDLSLPKVNVVSQDIGRVILNLINNAFYAVNERYKKEGKEGYVPQVNVSTRQVGDQIEITVTDNGGGIPPNIREKIFQPFFTTKPTGEGTGLGLSMSYDIITKGHGGKMEVVSKEGEGSSFILQIPM